MKKILSLALLVFPFSITFSQDLGSLVSTADYHYKSYIMGNVMNEGDSQIQVYSNGLVVRLYKNGTLSSEKQVFYYRQQGPYGTLIYVEPSNTSTYNSMEKYTDGRFNMYFNDPSNMFFSKSLSMSFTPGATNVEYNMWDQPAAPADNGYNSGSNYNSGNSYNSSSDGTLVGSYQALGLRDGENSRTDYFSVYKDSQGRYYVNLPSSSHNLMHSNTTSTYMGYNVSQYNYWFYDTYTRTFWYIRL